MGVTHSNSPTSLPYLLQVQRGLVPGASIIDIFGENNDVDTGSVPEDLWAVGGVRNDLTSATLGRIRSDNANDTSAGSGAQTFLLTGLDASYNIQTETLSMNGTSNVTTANSYLRFLSIRNTSGNDNVGVITFEDNVGTNVYMQIAAGDNHSLLSHYTVPEGKTGYFLRTYMNANVSDRGRFALQTKKENETWCTVRRLDVNEAHVAVNFEWSLNPLPEHTDVRMQIIDTSNNNSVFKGGYSLLLLNS